MVRVAVAGALGRLGRVAVAALHDLPDVSYVGGFARAAVPSENIVDDFDQLLALQPDVIVDVTTQPASAKLSLQAVAHGVRPVIGATAWTDEQRTSLARAVETAGIGAMLVPNFSIGAVLMMRFAQEAARFFPSVEIIEMHHEGKHDAPSGTAALTASRIASVRGTAAIPIHSVRLRGMVARQEVLFGDAGQRLSIKHESFSGEAYVPGILAAVRAVMNVRGLVIGLDSLLDQG